MKQVCLRTHGRERGCCHHTVMPFGKHQKPLKCLAGKQLTSNDVEIDPTTPVLVAQGFQDQAHTPPAPVQEESVIPTRITRHHVGCIHAHLGSSASPGVLPSGSVSQCSHNIKQTQDAMEGLPIVHFSLLGVLSAHPSGTALKSTALM
jgi:hypothetical protein